MKIQCEKLIHASAASTQAPALGDRLLGDAAAAEPEEQSGGLLDSLLNLFH